MVNRSGASASTASTSHSNNINARNDVSRISQDRARLRTCITGEEEAKEALHTRLWNIEQEGVETLGKLEEDVRKYNELALQLKMVPLGAKNSDGERYERTGLSSIVVLDTTKRKLYIQG